MGRPSGVFAAQPDNFALPEPLPERFDLPVPLLEFFPPPFCEYFAGGPGKPDGEGDEV